MEILSGTSLSPNTHSLYNSYSILMEILSGASFHLNTYSLFKTDENPIWSFLPRAFFQPNTSARTQVQSQRFRLHALFCTGVLTPARPYICIYIYIYIYEYYTSDSFIYTLRRMRDNYIINMSGTRY